MRIKMVMPVVYIFVFSIIGCNKNPTTNTPDPVEPPAADKFIRGADLSFLPEIEQAGTLFYTRNNQAKDVIYILKENGCNTIRIRLWHTPATIHGSLPEVVALANRVRAAGLKVWLDIHYSDTWADPGNQSVPSLWQNLSLDNLKDSVYNYTATVLSVIKPEYIQVGNEINGGFLWEPGRITNPVNFISLIRSACKAVRDVSPAAQIMIHYAGLDASWFFTLLQTNNVNYDMMAISYYPIWHGTSLDALQSSLDNLVAVHGKPIVIAETAYPFTLGYNDYTNNVVGLSSQIIPQFPATPIGQKDFLLALRKKIEQNSKGAGFCYWGTEWISFRGPTAADGSSWENQALFDFRNKELPAMELFKK